MRVLDANIFIRVITEDDAAKHEACARLFESLERGEAGATTTEVSIAEVMYVLTSRRWYGLGRDEAVALLKPLLSATGLRLEHKSRYLRALDLFAHNPFLDFEDAVIAAHAEDGDDQVVSYDRDFDRVPGIVRVEP